MSSISSNNDQDFSQRQGSVISLLDEDDPITSASDSVMKNTEKESSFDLQRSSSLSNDFSKLPNLDDTETMNFEKEYQIATIDLQAVPDMSNADSIIQSWNKQLSDVDQEYRTRTLSDSTDEITVSFGFQHQDSVENKQESSNENVPEEISSSIDYETLVHSRQLYDDPNPELIRKPATIAPLVYKQNITIKFLKPPPIPQGPLIIREVRPPQPPPPPPLIIRQRPRPILSPLPPIVLREKPPRIPELMTTQVITKTLPPLPPPPRSVIVEKIPPLPPKPRDIIIERWIPYESLTQKRQVIVQRAEPAKPHPQPKNVIITYDPVSVNVVRQVERADVTPEDPQTYSARYGNSLLDSKDLIAQARELGITEDISPPLLINREIEKQLTNNSSQQFKYERNSLGTHTTVNNVHNEIGNKTYAPTYDKMIDDTLTSMSSYEWNEQSIDQQNTTENLFSTFSQYASTKTSVRY